MVVPHSLRKTSDPSIVSAEITDAVADPRPCNPAQSQPISRRYKTRLWLGATPLGLEQARRASSRKLLEASFTRRLTFRSFSTGRVRSGTEGFPRKEPRSMVTRGLVCARNQPMPRTTRMGEGRLQCDHSPTHGTVASDAAGNVESGASNGRDPSFESASI